MEFKLKSIESILEIPKIANVHFFEFEKDHRTKDDSHSFYEMLFSYSGTLTIDSESYHGKLRRGEMIIHAAGERHSLRTHKKQKKYRSYHRLSIIVRRTALFLKKARAA